MFEGNRSLGRFGNALRSTMTATSAAAPARSLDVVISFIVARSCLSRSWMASTARH